MTVDEVFDMAHKMHEEAKAEYEKLDKTTLRDLAKANELHGRMNALLDIMKKIFEAQVSEIKK